ncbi:transglutaminase domain-containing protein [Puia sp.]|jgi:hypothetical protein|uniref:transglutaminase domain-containing protein n=1 Tax=Puia sp. TaxID=2045100 RepID=UPI002F3F0A60
MKHIIVILFGCLVFRAGRAQDKLPVRFGIVTTQDFDIGKTDSTTGAIIIAEYGESSFSSDIKGNFIITFTHSCRMRIIKRSAFDAATVAIPLFMTSSAQEHIEKLKASTYNLENGKVVETRLEDKEVFTDKLSKEYLRKKFAFPALKEGSIVEYTYKQVSPFIFNLQPWTFQRQYPCLWSEYQLGVPDMLQYVTLSYGFLPFDINTTETMHSPFNYMAPNSLHQERSQTIWGQVTTHRWVMKNVPALKPEPFTTSPVNYQSRLEFQLARYSPRSGGGTNFIDSWDNVGKELMKSGEFGEGLDKDNRWMDEDLKKVTAGAANDVERAQMIYTYVRDNFTCTAHNKLLLTNPLSVIYKNRNGSEAEINLLLAAMLRHVNIAADPVILSTRSNGVVNSVYPSLKRFNYVVIRIGNDDVKYFLDASEPWLSFGKLPERCYNGYARVLNGTDPEPVNFDPDSVRETKITMVILNRDKDGLTGHLQSTPGFYEACADREKIRKTGREEFIKAIAALYPEKTTPSDFEIDSVQHPEDPLQVAYDLHVSIDNHADILYFNPMMADGMKENPFGAADRRFPVEMPGTTDQVYTLSMDIPEGYQVTEVPQSTKVVFKEGKGSYEYVMVPGENNIQFRSRIRLDQAAFDPGDYDKLRDFFGYIVKKQSEQIVFKKKK